MAWIKVTHVLPDKPEVVGIAGILGIDQDAVVGKLVRLWIWADQQTVDGNADVTPGALHENLKIVTKAFIDRLVFTPNFADALEKVGWLKVKKGVLTFPNFDRHNGQTAKHRGVSARRVSKHRHGTGNAERNAGSVTESVTRPRPRVRKETGTGAYKALTVSVLRDDVALAAWIKANPTIAGATLLDAQHVFGLAERVLDPATRARKPAGMFIDLHKKQQWDFISNEQADRANQRIKRLQAGKADPAKVPPGNASIGDLVKQVAGEVRP